MSGGAVTDYQHDLYRISEWVKSIRRHIRVSDEYSEHTPEFKLNAEWLAEMLSDLGRCMDITDRVLSGDMDDDRGVEAIKEFRDTWFRGTGPSMGNLIDIEMMLRSATDRVKQMQDKCRPEEPDKMM